MAKKRQKLQKRAVTLAGAGGAGAHDRRATDLLPNAQVAPLQVDDPLEPGGKLIVLRSLRDDPLAALHAAGQIDQCQYIAGRHWQRAFELAQGTGLRAVDPTREAVDGGGIAQPTLSDTQSRAIDDLKPVTRTLGLEGEAIAIDVLGRGLTLAAVAGKRGLTSEADRKYIGRRFRETLDTMAVVFGYAMRGPLNSR